MIKLNFDELECALKKVNEELKFLKLIKKILTECRDNLPIPYEIMK